MRPSGLEAGNFTVTGSPATEYIGEVKPAPLVLGPAASKVSDPISTALATMNMCQR